MLSKIDYKYCLKERLNSLTLEEYKSALKTLPKALNITQRTFYRYINTRISEGYSMPGDNMAKLARFFNCRIEDMLNYEPPLLSSKEIKVKDKTDLL
jgi:hypothetical protein